MACISIPCRTIRPGRDPQVRSFVKTGLSGCRTFCTNRQWNTGRNILPISTGFLQPFCLSIKGTCHRCHLPVFEPPQCLYRIVPAPVARTDGRYRFRVAAFREGRTAPAGCTGIFTEQRSDHVAGFVQQYCHDQPGFHSHYGIQRGRSARQKSRMLASGQHDREFYSTMWESIEKEGRWQGEIWNRRKNGSIYPDGYWSRPCGTPRTR